MLPGYIQQTGVGRSSLWFPDRFQNPFNIGIGCVLLSGAATFNVEHAFEGIDMIFQMPWPVAAGQVNIPLPSSPPSVSMIGSPVVDLTTTAAVPAGATVTAVNGNVITISAAVVGGILAGDRISFLSWTPNPGITAATANANGNYAFPVRSISLNVTAGTGTVVAELIQAVNSP